MQSHLITIGNSKGIRLPKTILEQCQIKDDIVMEVKNREIRIKPARKKAREGWEEKIKKACKKSKPELLIDDTIDLDSGDWEW